MDSGDVRRKRWVDSGDGVDRSNVRRGRWVDRGDERRGNVW